MTVSPLSQGLSPCKLTAPAPLGSPIPAFRLGVHLLDFSLSLLLPYWLRENSIRNFLFKKAQGKVKLLRLLMPKAPFIHPLNWFLLRAGTQHCSGPIIPGIVEDHCIVTGCFWKLQCYSDVQLFSCHLFFPLPGNIWCLFFLYHNLKYHDEYTLIWVIICNITKALVNLFNLDNQRPLVIASVILFC